MTLWQPTPALPIDDGAYTIPPSEPSLHALWQRYEAQLAVKHIHSEPDLYYSLCCDYAKMLHGLMEIQSLDVDRVLSDFFADHASSIPPILANVEDHRLNHLGFEVYVPLDLWLHQMDEWTSRLSRSLGQPIHLDKAIRFPSSQALQKRVNASVEILCLWIRVGERVLMVELFDIARSVKAVLPHDDGQIHRYDSEILLTGEQVFGRHQQAMTHLFENDAIWHYAIHVENRQTVLQLHEEFRLLSAEQPRYHLAYETPVHNRHDGSFHTKIINLIKSLELEFATHEPPPSL
jgi:hypothetical protein